MNFVVITNNGGKMPVYKYAINSEEHFTYHNPKEIKYPSLSDKFSVGNYIVSIGDIVLTFALIFLTIFLFIINKGNINYRNSIKSKKGVKINE